MLGNRTRVADANMRRRTPGRKLRTVVQSWVGLTIAAALTFGPFATPVTASSGFDNHQGIDKCGDQTHTKVSDLWAGSPFYNYGVYIGGAEGDFLGCTSTTSFVAFVRGVGFGMFPIWDGLQAPCSANSKVMSSNTTTARNQGVTSAQNAQAAMSTFGFGSFDDVWLDMEAFSESNSSCRAAVHAYIDGWDSVLNSFVDAGVYANHSNVDSLFTLAHVPDAVWIAQWDTKINSVWGFSDIPNSHWINDQRIHQYRGSKTYQLPFGCSGSGCTDGSISVDVDCVNAYIDQGALTSDDDTTEGPESNSPTAEPTCNGPAQ